MRQAVLARKKAYEEAQKQRAVAELGRSSYGFEVNTDFYKKARDIMLKDYITEF